MSSCWMLRRPMDEGDFVPAAVTVEVDLRVAGWEGRVRAWGW